ncbi:MAG TPA: hypothetical protein VN914_08415 [Polyangia bacterium]|nr:hypothetical protein [Polyangia bacterium]
MSRPPIATLLIAALSSACSSSSTLAVDAGSTPDGGIAIRCDVVTQTCPAGQRCDFTCDNGTLVIACTPEAATPSQVGGSCSGRDAGAPGSSSTCMRGAGCFATSTKPASCYRYCRAGSECPQGTTCDTTTTFRGVCPNGSANLPVGLCR